VPKTDLNAITWQVHAGAHAWIGDRDLDAVMDWADDNNLHYRITTDHEITVANGRITYGVDYSPTSHRIPTRDIRTRTAPLLTPPPSIWQPDPAQLPALQAVLANHEWSAGFGGLCVDCSDTKETEDGVVTCHHDDAEPWPCPLVRDALRAGGFPLPPATNQSLRFLGDCLDPDANEAAFAAVSR